MATSHPPTRQTAFLVAGPVDEIDTAARRLRVASRDLNVIVLDHVRRLYVGDRVIVLAVRDPLSARLRLIGIVREQTLCCVFAQRALRTVLHAAMRIRHCRRTIRASQALFIMGGANRWPGARCIRCEGPLLREDRVTVEGNAPRHWACPAGLGGSAPMDSIGQLVSDADLNRVRQIVLDELRTAERDLAQRQEAQPDPQRAMDLRTLHGAITAVARLVVDGSE